MENPENPSQVDGIVESSTDYGALLKAAQSELPIYDRPVDIESGRDVVEKSRDAISFIEAKIVPGLPLSPNVEIKYREILHDMLSRSDSVLVDQDRQARYIRPIYIPAEGDRDGFYMGHESGDPTIEYGTDMHEKTVGWVQDAAVRSGVEITSDQTDKIAYTWLIAHELGHAFQDASRLSSGVDLPETTVAAMHLAEFTDDGFKFENRTVESERFAEGFGQMIVERYLISELGIDEIRASKLREELTPPERVEKMKETSRIYLENGPIDYAAVDWREKVNKRSEELKGLTINNIGYGSPHDPDMVLDIIKSSK